jgi:ABC-type dipeptide/oligopeptide/nickel transport system permease subunit
VDLDLPGLAIFITVLGLNLLGDGCATSSTRRRRAGAA